MVILYEWVRRRSYITRTSIMEMLSYLIKYILLIIFTIGFLVACSERKKHADLHEFIDTTLKKPGRKIEPLPEIKLYKPYEYSSSDLRSPFMPVQREIIKAKSNIEGPDLERTKEPLEAFALDSLKMVGTFNSDNKYWALIAGPNSEIYPVTVGNYMGKDFGKVIEITRNKIKLKELFLDKEGDWTARETTLVITDK